MADDELPLPPAHLLLPDDDDETFPEPPPDYDGEVRDNQDFPGLIPPSKLPNPVLESRDRVQLNKDIKFNVKHGINVLNTKPELKKELERRKLDRQKKEMVEKQRQNRNSFEQKMDIQRERLHSSENAEKILEEEANESELMRACNKIKGKSQVQQ
ncbi:protein FAM107B-like isoform X2 [Watersipora subatra]|uniref:protein FAM107B-like isoform X2 n=1 Tax=Watersipora subatra TaxID=2589382 RepID=UPI00355B8814